MPQDSFKNSTVPEENAFGEYAVETNKNKEEAAAVEKTALYERLLLGTGRGEREAFCRLYEETGRILYSYALSLVRNREDAEDAVQDAFIRIRSAAHLYRPMGKPLAWMLTIERNLCLMRLRTRNRFSDRPLTQDGGRDTAVAAEQSIAGTPAQGRTPEALQDPCSYSSEVENRLILQKALQCLSEEESSIVLLHAAGGMKHREIAQQMQMPLSTVLSKYRRALQKLRKELIGTVP